MESILADSFTDNMSELAGLFIGFGLVVLIPLVYMFLHHQRKMAALLHQNTAKPNQLDRLESEVRELRDRVNHLILLQESASALPDQSRPPSISNRLN